MTSKLRHPSAKTILDFGSGCGQNADRIRGVQDPEEDEDDELGMARMMRKAPSPCFGSRRRTPARRAYVGMDTEGFVMSPPCTAPARPAAAQQRWLEHRHQARGGVWLHRRLRAFKSARRPAGELLVRVSAATEGDSASIDQRPVAGALPARDDVVHDVAEGHPGLGRRTRRATGAEVAEAARVGSERAARAVGLKPSPKVTSSCRIGQYPRTAATSPRPAVRPRGARPAEQRGVQAGHAAAGRARWWTGSRAAPGRGVDHAHGRVARRVEVAQHLHAGWSPSEASSRCRLGGGPGDSDHLGAAVLLRGGPRDTSAPSGSAERGEPSAAGLTARPAAPPRRSGARRCWCGRRGASRAPTRAPWPPARRPSGPSPRGRRRSAAPGWPAPRPGGTRPGAGSPPPCRAAPNSGQTGRSGRPGRPARRRPAAGRAAPRTPFRPSRSRPGCRCRHGAAVAGRPSRRPGRPPSRRPP